MCIKQIKQMEKELKISTRQAIKEIETLRKKQAKLLKSM